MNVNIDAASVNQMIHADHATVTGATALTKSEQKIVRSDGLWTTWCLFILSQLRPFCRWVAVALDRFSRRVMGVAVHSAEPTSVKVRRFPGRTVRRTTAFAKHLICDIGAEFWSNGFKAWSGRMAMKPRFGAVCKRGDLAVAERFLGMTKRESAPKAHLDRPSVRQPGFTTPCQTVPRS